MPSYDWACDQHRWVVVSTIADRDEPSSCPKCQAPGTRMMSLPAPVSVTAGDWNRGSWNPGLGCYTKSWKHGRQIAKERGLEEVGDSDPDALYKENEKAREDKRAGRWADDRELVYE